MSMYDTPALLYDVLSAKPRAQRHLCAHRWEIPVSAARMMVERMTDAKHAEPLARRIMKAGAPNLLPLLIEYGGCPVRRDDSLMVEASMLRDWHILVESKNHWRIPLDLSVAMLGVAYEERLFLSTLLARISEDDLAAVRTDFGLTTAGSRAYQIGRLRQRILEDLVSDDELLEASSNAKALESVATDELEDIRYVGGSRGCIFDIVLTGETIRVAARDVAELEGYSFAQPSIEGSAPRLLPLQELDVPEWTPIGGIITFVSINALQRALEEPSFTSMITEQIGDRRVLLSPEHNVQDAHLALTMLGYEPTLADPE